MKYILTLALLLIVGCMANVTVDKRPNLALPIYSESSCSTNPVEYVIVDQGYKVRYMKIGFNTDIQSMSAEISTNKTVTFSLGGLHSYSTNNVVVRVEDLVNILKVFRDVTNQIDAVERAK